MTETKPDPSRCPLCGEPNRCAMLKGEADCWCRRVTIPREVIERIPPEAKGVACVCERCATASHAHPQ